ncbi:hypothetical protein [Alkalicoccus luteus]|uniref:Uncharacterized protein n=1 Tax=Alkalicoccus luteus TaxID=1237094 RepID=A0A969PMY4_9BACI|nr:hypothetical protein [Alkalicoccus luteus]NJP37175.1 hypothetical protein [Alkalicoccus luteus]
MKTNITKFQVDTVPMENAQDEWIASIHILLRKKMIKLLQKKIESFHGEDRYQIHRIIKFIDSNEKLGRGEHDEEAFQKLEALGHHFIIGDSLDKIKVKTHPEENGTFKVTIDANQIKVELHKSIGEA